LKNIAAQIERLKGDMIANIANNIRQLQIVKQKYTPEISGFNEILMH